MRRLLTILVPLVAIVLGLWAGGWYVATRQLIAALDRWADERRAEGWHVAYGPPSPAGFPTKVAVEIPEPDLAVPASGAGAIAWNWRAPSVRVEIVPWQLDRVVLRNRGENRVSARRGDEAIAGTLGSDDATVRLEGGRVDHDGHYVVKLTQPKLELDQPIAVAAQAGALEVDLRLSPAPPGDHLAVAAALGVDVTDLAAPQLDQVGATPITASLRAELMGAIPAGPPDRTVAAWRDDGGTIEVRQMLVKTSGITMTANGTLALDSEMRPIGAANAAIRGYAEAIDRLSAAGVVKPRDAQLAKVILSAMAQPDDDGTRVLNVPISGQNGWLYVGPVRLVRLEPLKLR
ncbi:MAG TPA: DUF2125 domain-containing protein [Candidatus Sulfotelmatobacter sp.]|nr:DUF2125 domain-containing protein [Candidatus Sulfotelmatobacter sp.]